MSQSVFNNDIFHNLPTFPSHDGKKYTAIVTGANGITGAHLLRVLSAAPERWEKIYALSRRVPDGPSLPNVKSLAIDFLKSPESIAESLREGGVKKVDYVFFASYLQPPPREGQGLWSDLDETEKVNMALLSNFLTALSTSSLLPKRFILQTGAKHYGVHIGPTLSPMQESDPRFLAHPNFYFPQEDLLWSWSKENAVEWNVTRPGFIIGAVREAAMNIAYGLALYAAIQKELNAPLVFPGDADAWAAEKQLSSALLIAYHAEWAALTAEAGNEVLNHSDGGNFSYGGFWPVLAALYGLEYKAPEDDDEKYTTITMPLAPPPRGFGAAGKFRLSSSLEEWAKTEEVLKAWEKVKKEFQLVGNPFEKPKDVFGLLDAEILGPWGRSISMNKNRKLGWNGFVDSHDGLIKTFEELSDLKMIPPFEKPETLFIEYQGY